MNKFNKSQIFTLTILVLLLMVTPFLSSSFRSIYLYFVINFVIVTLVAEAGILSAFSKPVEDKKPSPSFTLMPRAQKEAANSATKGETGKKITTEECHEKKPKVIEKGSMSENILGVSETNKVKRLPSMPSSFSVGGGETTEVDEATEEYCEAEEMGGLNGYELFTKAEAFIGDFYKQLNMQREESWKSTHGF